MEIGVKLKQARLKKELTQENVANILNVSRSTISSWEVGRSYPDLESLVSLSDLYNISLDSLLRADSEMVKKLSLDSKITNNIIKVLKYITIISFFVFIFSILYINIANNTYDRLSNQISDEMKSLSLKYNMIELNTYKKELDSIFNKNKFNEINSIEIYVADMENGNKDLETSKDNFKLLYTTVDPKSKDGVKLFKNSIVIGSKDLLDKDSNIVHYQPYLKDYNIYTMQYISLAFGVLCFLSLLGNIIINFRISSDN